MAKASGCLRVAVLTLIAGQLACGGKQQVITPEEDGSTASDADGARDGGADSADGPPAEVTLDSDGLPVGASLTFLATDFFLADDRICDLDGDGLPDNSMADLGIPSSTIFIGALNAMMAGDMPTTRFLCHFPWVEDIRGPDDPDSVFILFHGLDTDMPADLDDDYSGSEPFYVRGAGVDGCGEPLDRATNVPIQDGRFSGGLDSYYIGFFESLSRTGMTLQSVTVIGAIAPSGASMSLEICAGVHIGDLGDQPGFLTTSDLTLLESFLDGGRSLGVPTVPGLTPDLDLDGDGIERFVLDEEGHITSCIDGDNQVFEGRDCWSREEIADGFSLVWNVESTPALRADLEPNWLAHTDGVCDDPPEQSLWDP